MSEIKILTGLLKRIWGFPRNSIEIPILLKKTQFNARLLVMAVRPRARKMEKIALTWEFYPKMDYSKDG